VGALDFADVMFELFEVFERPHERRGGVGRGTGPGETSLGGSSERSPHNGRMNGADALTTGREAL